MKDDKYDNNRDRTTVFAIALIVVMLLAALVVLRS